MLHAVVGWNYVFITGYRLTVFIDCR